MKGLILASGEDTNLHPLKDVMPAALLPVAYKPTCKYALEKLKGLGIDECGIVADKKHITLFKSILGNNVAGLSITYIEQDGLKGDVDAIKISQEFIADEQVVVIKGDQVFNDTLDLILDSRKRYPYKAQCFIHTPKEIGRLEVLPTVEYSKLENVIKISSEQKSQDGVVGVYYLPKGNLLPTILDNLDEGSMVDILNKFHKEDKLMFNKLSGLWNRVDSAESLANSTLMAISWIRPFG